jgi:ADP-heptose:LPS heptosyltransferase
MWPVERFAELAEHLQSRLRIQIILCGGKDESAICEEIVKELKNSSVINLAGKTTLIELINIIRNAALVVCNESSPAHLAAAVGTPSVCIQGGGHFGRFLPYEVEHLDGGIMPTAIFEKMECFNCQWLCKFELVHGAAVPCVAGVKTDRVFNICKELLSNPANKKCL